jgi:hypothetical protein
MIGDTQPFQNTYHYRHFRSITRVIFDRRQAIARLEAVTRVTEANRLKEEVF